MNQALLKIWLEIDLYNIAKKLDFIENDIKPTHELILKTIHCLDNETKLMLNANVNYVITLVALMWEYCDPLKYNLKNVIIKFLSRIGYPTSAMIVDNKFNKDKCQFSSMNSILEQILVTLNQDNNIVNINNHPFLLTSFQLRLWRELEASKCVGVSAPTSAGKSFIILLKLLEKLIHTDFDIIYIVPTLSLQNQVTKDFKTNIKCLNIERCRISNSYNENKDNLNNIFILTQEKLISAINDTNNTFLQNMIFVVDEIQNIERINIADDDRSKILYDVLQEFSKKDNVLQFIISGPRISDIKKTGENIFKLKTIGIDTKDNPVLNITYSISMNENQYFLNQYCLLTPKPLRIKIENSSYIKGYNQKRYTTNFLNYLNVFINKFSKEKNIIFAPTTDTARKIACSIDTEITTEQNLTKLIDYYKKTVHPNYDLCKTLIKGVAYHHGKLPDHVRKTLETAISDKLISTTVCTTTLLQGVNLPTQNIIIRNPHLYQNKTVDAAELTNYEMANLRGRAGRLLKEFIGRTFVLEEKSFIDTTGYDKEALFENVEKKLPDTYEERFNKYKDDIYDTISSTFTINDNMRGFGDLVTYIRQSILKYGEYSEQIMKKTGINLSKEEIAEIKYKLEKISIPKDICIKNRYWDPFILDKIYNNFTFNVPSHPKEKGCKNNISNMLKFLRDTPETQYMYNKYIPEKYRKGASRIKLCSLCMEWMNETSLNDIIISSKSENNIDETIETLQNTISYKIPLLLRPIFDIKNPNSSIPSCMETGGFHKTFKALINLGISRECSLSAYNKILYSIENDDSNNLENKIINLIYKNLSLFEYWEQKQLEHILK